MSIAERLQKIKATIPHHVTLVAVSKTHPVGAIQEAYDAGQRIFGENKVQEMTEKQPLLPADVEWHLIGHLQTNKVKYIAPFVSLIHSVDSEKLLAEIDKRAAQNNRVIDCLLQVYIAKEESKFGLDELELEAVLDPNNISKYKNVRIVGLMGMATFTDNENQVHAEFKTLKTIFDLTKARTQSIDNVQLNHLSMGMSGDYQLAIEEGSTMVRIGSSIFGNRNYNL